MIWKDFPIVDCISETGCTIIHKEEAYHTFSKCQVDLWGYKKLTYYVSSAMLCYVMGEMADMLFEQCIDEFGNDGFGYSPARKLVCKFCGKKNLVWKHVSGRWLMYEKNEEIHDCPKNPLTVDTLKHLGLNKKETHI